MTILGGIFTEALFGATALVITSTGLIGGAARYGAVLANRSEREVERATAVGFKGASGHRVQAQIVDAMLGLDGPADDVADKAEAKEAQDVNPEHVVHPGLLEGWGVEATQIKEDTG